MLKEWRKTVVEEFELFFKIILFSSCILKDNRFYKNALRRYNCVFTYTVAKIYMKPVEIIVITYNLF